MEPRKERFSIRKFSIGAASVLIGFSFMSMTGNQKVQAATEKNPLVVTQDAERQPKTDGAQSAEQQSNKIQSSAAAVNTQNNKAADAETVKTTTTSNQNATDSKVTQSPAANSNQNLSKDGAHKEVKETTPGEAAAPKEVKNVDEASHKTEAPKDTNTLNLNRVTATQASVKEEKVENRTAKLRKTDLAAILAAPQEKQTKTLRGTQSQEVSDWQGFVNAMNDASVGTIKLTSDITVANKGTNVNGIHRPQPLINSGKMNLTGSNISGGLDIDGQNHAINFGANYLSFDTNNQKDSNPWDIDFKNLTINADGYDNSWSTLGGAFSPFYMGGDDIKPTSLLSQNKVTFENVTADIKNGAFYTTTMATQAGDDPYTTVTFKGNNNITAEAVNVAGNQLYNYSSAVSAAHIIFADGTNTVFNVGTAKTNNDQNPGGNILRAKIEDSDDTDPAIDVQQDATVTLNGKSTDVKGMLVNSATTGTVQVDGNLNTNMADGSSIAIWAGNLNIGKTGVVNIDTKQSNDGTGANGVTNYNGYHYAPISLGVGFAFNVTNADSNVLDNAGTLVIKRTGDNKSTSPLISFGSGNGTGSIFTVNVQDGATLDLQDSAQSSIVGATTNTPNVGLITMWGSGNGSATSSDTINITNPAYVNFQRTGNQTGTLLRLENQVNHVNIQSNGGRNPLPLAQWDEGNYNNPSYYWYINNLTTQNNWGNNSISGFAGKGQTVGANKAGEAKFLHSNGTVTMGGSQAGLNQYQYTNGTITQGQPNPGVDYETPYLNKFLNNFNWWTPQRISMGTNLETKVTPTDSEKYQPVVQTIDGTTKQTLSDLTAKDGIKGLLSSDGTETTDLSSVKSVSWYDAATDSTEWNSVMGDEAKPTNPTGNLKTTDKSAWAKVTYTDGSVDFANIPLNITEPMANLYTPSYKPVNVEQGQTATVDPSFTTQDDKDATAPTGTTFTTGTDTPDWATIDPSTGTVTVKPGTDVTPGAYNVPVTVTYPDKSTDETTVPVIVTKAGQTVTWGDNGAVVTTVDTSKLNAHETTDNSQVLSAAGVVTAEGYELTDGKLSTTATPITIDPSTVSWTTTPDTNVDTATAAGKEITTSVNVDFTNNDAAKNILGSKNGVVTTNPFTIDAKGAGAKNVTTPVKVDLGSDLTSEQFSQLVDNNIPTDEIASTTWATKPDANGQGGVIKITFTDKDANGNPTYLNVNIPASSIKVTTDADKYTPAGQDVSTKAGEVPDAEKGIKNPGSLPSGTTYTWQDTPDTTKPGKKPAVVVVTYPDGSKDTVPTDVIVNAKPEIKTITTTVGGDPAATQGIANLNNGGTSPVEGYPSSATWTTKPDTSKPGATTGTAVVTYPDGTTETVTIPVAVNGNGDVTIIDDKGHTFSLHANDVVTHKTSDKNIIGGPVIESFKLSYYQGGQSYSKPYIYTLNADKTAYVLTQTGDNPAGVTVNAPQSINASDIKISWTEANTVLFNNALGAIMGNGQPTSLDTAANNGGTGTIEYTNWKNNQFGYPKYSAVVNSSGVNWPIYGKGPVSTYPFPSVYIYGAEANGTIPSVYSDTTDLQAALGKASNLVNTSDLTADHNSEISSVDWQTLPSRAKANAKAPATVRINFTDGSYLDVPVAVNVIKVDQGVDDKTNHDIYRDITRTINVEGESTPVVQHVIYSRAKITDLSKPADQQVTYTDWAPAKNSEDQVVTNFPQYEVTKPGYTATATGATIETVDGKQYVPASGTITEDSANEVVNVTYAANEHTLVINYVDGNGTVVGTYNVPGKTDETVNVDVPGNVPTNWKLVPNQQVIGSYKFGSDDPQPVDYKVEHGTEVVPVDKNNKNTYRKITQTIQEVPAGKTNADMHVVRTTSVEFERTGVKDLVTGETTWNSWNSNSETFPVYNIKEQKGYDSYVNDVKATEVAAVTVNPDSSDITDTITYVKQDATPVPYDPTRDDMSVTRTINYEVPAGHEAIAPVTQTVEYTRDVNGVAGYQDPVTGEFTWNAWHVKSGKAEFASVSVEQIKGYDSYVDGTKSTEVAAAQVTEKDGVPQNGAAVNVTYTANEHTLVINYVDGNGNVVGTYNVPGKTDETVNVDVSGHVPTNWKLVPDQQTISSYKFGSDDPQPIDYKIEHGTKDITPNDPSVNPTDPKYKNMFTTVSRDIYQTKPGEIETKIDTQYVDFGRNGVEDLVTGVVTGTGDWKVGKIENNKFVEGGKAEFASENAPQIKGYDSYVDGIKSTEVPAASALKDGQPVDGVAVHITYVKQAAQPLSYDPARDDMSVTRTINYEVPTGHEAIAPVTQTVEYTRDVNGVAGYQDPVTGEFTWNAWHVKSGKAEFASVSVEQIKGYDSYVDGTKSTEVAAAAVTEKDGVPQNGVNVTVSYQKQADTPVPYKPGQEGVNDDMNQYVTRTIVVHEPGQDPVSYDQTVHFTREDAQGNAGYTDPVNGKITWNAWHVAGELNQANGTWAEFNAPTVKGYTPSQAKVAAEEVTAETKNATVDITYNLVAPTGQNVTTKVGEVPDADQGIANKGDLPDGTKYSWKTKPDVSTEGEKPAVVIVTYPGGSTVEVPVTVTVTKNPTDADKYTPEGQDVNTKTGVVPDPAEGIKNKSDLPDGTKYTWEKTPDVTKPGESTGVIVVTYPDGSKDEVTVKVIVNTNNVTPETQPIHTTPGVLPNPADAIKNKDEMPAGTKYTWKEVPNVNTVGEHTGVITVTYPDGSSVDLTVKVYVDAVAKENNSENTAQVITKPVAENNEKKTSATPAQQIKHSEKATLPQTGAKSENTAGILGLAIAAVGSLFGLGAGKKRRDK